MEYLYNDFLNTLDKTGQVILNTMNEHINSHYSEYKPFDIKPTDKSKKEWRIHYRKKPKVGKAICSVYSSENKLSLRFCLLSSMTHEFLLRKNEFSHKIRNNTLKQMICVVHKSCRNYGGNIICQVRQYYLSDNRLIMTCPYPWISIDDCDENDIADIKLLIDMQMKHMAQDSKDIKGALYAEVNMQKCGEVKSINLDAINLNVNMFEISNHVKKVERLDRYTQSYDLVPMGEKDGLWFYFSDDSVLRINREKNEYSHNKIPKGRYAMVVIEDPFTFSLNRVWNYICKWTQENKEIVKGLVLSNNKNTACFSRFFIEDSKDFMALYVPIK